jgi:hypothetical protein
MHPVSNVVQSLAAPPAVGLVEPPGPALDALDGEHHPVDRTRHHRLMLRLSIAAVCLAFLLEVLPDGIRVAVRGFSDYPLPETCGTKLLFDAECPACGLTRSFIWAAHRQWGRSIQANRIGLVVLAACVAQIPYRMLMLRTRRVGRFAESKWAGYFGWSLIVLIIGNWAFKLSGL